MPNIKKINSSQSKADHNHFSLICFNCQRSLINYIFTQFFKTKNNSADTNERINILH
jgi:hypothetical protein